MKSKFLALPNLPVGVDVALLILRVVCGLAFMIHGSGKIQNPMHWMGPEAGTPGVLQALAAISEFGGGLAWVLGLLTRVASLGIISTMVVAVCTHALVMGDPFVNLTGGRSFEPAAVFLVVAILLLAAGPGRYSIDRKLFGHATK